ncbi:TldD/PmbA family protein [Methanocalculus taiwanensis]|uniref:TldD/PmbA family protein n=1 Tax=Methanocalculus taiwanensis TaxID=106207 RepID=A0ABD4TIH5_9EURY|nr:metallopeptidase TldD-related protein [Methanocalculus taiwanensis]MCQ1538737.1 TldD/PmbA family protein [Methanocalculus taiwanensis]
MHKEVISDIIETGLKYADEVEVALLTSESVSIEMKRSVPAYAGESFGTALIIRVIDSGRIGSSGTSTIADWRVCLDSAVSSAHLAEPVPWGGLPDPVSLKGGSLSYDSAVKTDPDIAHTFCNRLLEGASVYPEAEVVGGGAGLSLGSVILANSCGICYEEDHSSVSASLETIAGQSTGFEYDRSYSLDIDPFEIGRRAAELAQTSQHGVPIETGIYDLLLSPMAFAGLCASLLSSALNGRSVHMGRSFLAEKLGEVIGAEHLSVIDDPFYPGGLGSGRFDAEGVPTRENILIEDGVLKSFIYDLKTAYRFGKESTGNAQRGGLGGGVTIGMHNMVFCGETMQEPGEGRCISINDVIGAHTANPLTGDFSVEVQNAFIMEDGVVQEPVRKAMIAGNIFDMFGQMTGMGRTPRRVGSVIVPAVRIDGMRLVG